MVELINNENLFLILLAIVWIIGAIIQDMRRREVDNLWNFSLIGIALAYRLAVSIDISNYWYFFNGVIGLVVFLLVGNAFYYSRLFAGGDAKLLIALGTILPLSYNWIINFKIFGLFIMMFLIGGSIYVFSWSFILVFFNFNNFKKEFGKEFKRIKSLFGFGIFFAALWILASYFLGIEFVVIGLIFILFPALFAYTRAVEHSCMIKRVSSKDLTVGDWLHEDIFVGGKKIRKDWQGVSKEELLLIRKKYKRKILVRYGVPFTPSFLIGLIGLLWINKVGLI